MPIEWKHYHNFDWGKSQQKPMTEKQKDIVIDFVANTINLSSSDYRQIWGIASPPGRYAATVIHLLPNINNSYQDKRISRGIKEIGVKVFKTTKDAQREAKKIVPFHREYVSQLPGLPNEYIQKSIDAGIEKDKTGEKRAFVIQQWVEGKSLEYLIRYQWQKNSITGDLVKLILGQLFANIIFPLWKQGTI